MKICNLTPEAQIRAHQRQARLEHMRVQWALGPAQAWPLGPVLRDAGRIARLALAAYHQEREAFFAKMARHMLVDLVNGDRTDDYDYANDCWLLNSNPE